MQKKTNENNRVGISRTVQWIWVQRWPLLIILAPVIAAPIFYGIHLYLAPERIKNKSGDEFLQEQQIAQVKKDVLQITSQVLVGITLLSGAYFAWKWLEARHKDQITDRYTRAIDELGSKHLEIRLGGIYALERLAKDSRIDQETVMEVLTAFVRENSSKSKTKPSRIAEEIKQDQSKPSSQACDYIEKPKPNTDIQASLTVIGRRTWEVPGRIDLSGAYLLGAYWRGANLNKANLIGANLNAAILMWANLSEADLSEADLNGADLFWAHLQGANLQRAHLRGAHLQRANLIGAYLVGANLCGANLRLANLSCKGCWNWVQLNEAKLQGANLTKANLGGADLSGADLSGADLSGADLGGINLRGAILRGTDLLGADLDGADLLGADLGGANLNEANLRGVRGKTPYQIRESKNWQKATYGDDFMAQLGLPTASEEIQEKPKEQPPPLN